MRHITSSILATTLALLVAVGNSHATSIVIVARDRAIYIGADGQRVAEGSSEPSAPRATCKVEKIGTFLISHAGASYIVFANKNGAPVPWFDVDSIIRSAINPSLSLDNNANSLDSAFWNAYLDRIQQITKLQDSPLRRGLVAEFNLAEFVVAGRDKSGTPKAIVLMYAHDFDNRTEPLRKRITVEADRTVMFLGWDDAGLQFREALLTHDVKNTIIDYLAAESRIHPSQVMTPFTVASISQSGIEYEQAGSCTQRKANKPAPKAH